MGKFIKNKKIIILLVLLGGFAIGSEVSAALNVAWPQSPFGTELREDSLTILVKYLYEWGISIGVLAAFIALVIAGFQYLTSAGNAIKMKDAMSRIQFAVIGLVLLLGSVLILNTINPQLTQLKIPDIKLELTSIETKTLPFLEDLTPAPCERVTIYKGTGWSGVKEDLPVPYQEEDTWKEIGSVEIVPIGSCQLLLYSMPDYREDSDKPVVVITTDIKDIGLFSSEEAFRSLKVIDLHATTEEQKEGRQEQSERMKKEWTWPEEWPKEFWEYEEEFYEEQKERFEEITPGL